MKIIDKLQKLINHEKSAREIGNVAEAEAFAGKIQQLLIRHNLSMSEIEIETAKTSEIDIEPAFLFSRQRNENWKFILASTIAELHGCNILQMDDLCQLIVGRETDRQIVLDLYQHFIKTGKNLAGNFMNNQVEKSLREIESDMLDSFSFGLHSLSKPDFFSSNDKKEQSFLYGFAVSVCERLSEINQEEIENTKNSVALVYLGNRLNENKQWIDENIKVAGNTEFEEPEIDRRSYFSGRSAGNNIALTNKLLK